MTTFKPTKENLFDYHLNLTDPELTRAIENYLNRHPEEKCSLEDFTNLEKYFKTFPLKSPSAETLEQVRLMAKKQIQTSFLKSFFQKQLFGMPMTRSLAWMTTIVLVIGLSFVLNDIKQNNTMYHEYATPTIIKTSDTDTTKAATRQAKEDIEKQNLITMTPSDTTPQQTKASPQEIKAYKKALILYKQKQFENAALIFENIITKNPAFEKRIDLYTHWINALEEMGQSELASNKKNELEQILRGESL